MKKKLTLLFLSLTLFTSCSPYSPSFTSTPYNLTFISENSSKGDIFDSITVYLPPSPQEISPQILLEFYLNYQPELELYSPFPANLSVFSTQLLDSGILDIEFSPEYGELSGISRTVADYAITLTLTQLPRVGGVRIYVFGEETSETPPLLRTADIKISDLQEETT